jgi:xanthine dehydrogenase accessory factor
VQEEIYRILGTILSEGKRGVLARIVRRTGSAPRGVGSGCLILEDGSLIGTIGGGLLEHRVMERAEAVLADGKSSVFRFELSGEALSGSEMICGGLVDVYLEPLVPDNPETAAVFRAIPGFRAEGRKAVFITRMADGIPATDTGQRMLVAPGFSSIGSVSGLQAGWDPLESSESFRLIRFPKSGATFFTEALSGDAELVLFGAGHVSTSVAPLARTVGFRVTVVDDRPEFASRERFPEADEIFALPFPEAFKRLSIGRTTYIAILTRGHTHDEAVLREALRARPAYIGMIGSRRKRDAIYGNLVAEGVTPEALRNVHSPIGIPIEAETPEEIAVSIVAELIRIRADKQGKRV